MSKIEAIEDRLDLLEKEMAIAKRDREQETITVKQAAAMCGFEGEDTNEQVYNLIKASNGEIETNKPRPRMLRINKKSLQVFLSKNPQYNKIRIAA